MTRAEVCVDVDKAKIVDNVSRSCGYKELKPIQRDIIVDFISGWDIFTCCSHWFLTVFMNGRVAVW